MGSCASTAIEGQRTTTGKSTDAGMIVLTISHDSPI